MFKSITLDACGMQIYSGHYLLGDLEYDLQEEIIDAFQDVRVVAGTEFIKQGEVADNFYIIVSVNPTMNMTTPPNTP
jgi:hypothetical protein